MKKYSKRTLDYGTRLDTIVESYIYDATTENIFTEHELVDKVREVCTREHEQIPNKHEINQALRTLIGKGFISEH